MKHSVLVLAVAFAASAAACSAAPSSSLEDLTTSNAVVAAAPTPPRLAADAGANEKDASTPLPIPSTGPGSADSTARQYFIDQVYPALSQTCAQCHATGNGGAPMFLQTNAATAYQTMDGRGLIQPQSALLTKGQHEGPALTTSELALVQEWLNREAKERVGQAAPVNILDKIGSCLSEQLFDAIGFENLVTEPRQGEDPNTCTGCNATPCSHCHTGGDGGFYMAVGSGIDATTFQHTKQTQFIVKYIGLNGSQPVASNAIAAKSIATQNDGTYLHPMFKLTPAMKTAIDNFVQSAITAYGQHLCGQ